MIWEILHSRKLIKWRQLTDYLDLDHSDACFDNPSKFQHNFGNAEVGKEANQANGRVLQRSSSKEMTIYDHFSTTPL